MDNPTEKKEKTTWAEKASSKTHHLTTENYDDFIKNHENVLIFFHALYAADLCAPMMDEWDLAAAELAETEDETYFLAAVDQVNSQVEIRGSPVQSCGYGSDGKMISILLGRISRTQRT